jgi:hypothetical protein
MLPLFVAEIFLTNTSEKVQQSFRRELPIALDTW